MDDVSHATLTYQAADNFDPDGDSDGTPITVTKPLIFNTVVGASARMPRRGWYID